MIFNYAYEITFLINVLFNGDKRHLGTSEREFFLSHKMKSKNNIHLKWGMVVDRK